MADKNIGTFNVSPVDIGMYVIGVDGAGPGGTPVLFNPSDVGGVGPEGASAYEVAVANGYVGTEAAWLASLKGVKGDTGDPGAPGEMGASIVPDEYGTLNEAKVTAITTANVDWNMLVIAEGDDRANQAVPAGIAGDMSGHLIRYETGGTWLDLGPIVGVTGPAGPTGSAGAAGKSGVPDQQAVLTEALITTIETAAVDWLLIVSDDTRANQAIPATIAGDMTGNAVFYNAATDTWSLVGQWIGDTGPAGADGTDGGFIPVYEMLIAHSSANVANGSYPVSIYTPVAFTITTIAVRCNVASGGGGAGSINYTISANGVALYDDTIESADDRLVIPVSLAVPLGAELWVTLDTSATNLFAMTIIGEVV